MGISNNQRRQLSRKLWSMINNIASRNISLRNDPLGGMYEVNRFSICVSHINEQWLRNVVNTLVSQFKEQGWIVENEKYTRVESPDGAGGFYFHPAHYSPGDRQWVIDIGIST